jgi:hypothetical protein
MKFWRLIPLLLALCMPRHAAAEGFVSTLVKRFAESDFVFTRGRSNAPLPPLGWIAVTDYQQTEFTNPDGSASGISAEQSTLSISALVPIPVTKRDALVIGAWTESAHFDLENARVDALDVLSVSVPIGWARQLDSDWQLGAFVAPLGHRTSEDDWYWETLGGVFARYVHDERFAWVFGVYFDVAPLEDLYLPYLGATFLLDERWTINAILPWPSITYAPSTKTLFRLGVSPSGTSWSVQPGALEPRVNFSAWNFGAAFEKRLWKNVWFGVEAGVSGLRGLSFAGDAWQDLETDLGHTGYAMISVNLRPGGFKEGE